MRTLAVEWSGDIDEDRTRETVIREDNTSWTEETDVVGEEVGREIEEAIEACALSSFNTSNKLLFSLGRRVRGIEQQHHLRFAPTLLRTLFDQWACKSVRYLRSNHDYFVEFLVKLGAVRHRHGATLAAALEAAYPESPPTQVLVLEDPDIHLLANLCRELQHRAGNQPFYLIGRACADLLGRPHSTVASWLCAFRTLGILQVMAQGRPGRGSRYRYVAGD